MGKPLCVAALSFALNLVAVTMNASANGNSFWLWQFSGDNGGATGKFEVNSNNVIIGITGGLVFGFPGIINVSSITSILNPGTFFYNDNTFNPSSTFLSSAGVSFFAGANLNMYCSKGNYYVRDDKNNTSFGSFLAILK